MKEWDAVSGGVDSCSSSESGNTYGGVSNTETVGQEIVNIYEGLVAATSHIIERVADAF